MADMKIVYKNIEALHPYENNPRKNDDAVEALAQAIQKFGWKQPIVIDKDNVIVAGHTRYKAAKLLQLTTIPCVIADDLTDEEVKAYRLADNKIAELSGWDFEKLSEELDSIVNIDMSDFGFDFDDCATWNTDIGCSGSLKEEFLVPPFSILDTTQGYWQERKKSWANFMQGSGIEGRNDTLISSGLYDLTNKCGMQITGTSTFDPVLAELLYTWFCIPEGNAYDPFAGGVTRGLIAAVKKINYTGIELRREQIEENCKMAKKAGVSPRYICDSSINADKYLKDNTMDFVISCPPYYDLEKYSDDPADISNMEYKDFLNAYEKIIQIAVGKLKNDRFAAWVVGDVRDKNGIYRDLVSETKRIFIKNDAFLYNDMILKEPIATGAIRARSQFARWRKVVKNHQNVLIFFKGNPKNIKNCFDEIEVAEIPYSSEKEQICS